MIDRRNSSTMPPKPKLAPHLGVKIDELGELFDDLHVLDHLLAHTGPLDLHGDAAAVAQHGPMHLAERGAGHRRGVKGLERLGDAGTDLGGDGLFDRVERDRFDVVLEAGQRVEVDGRKQVGRVDRSWPSLMNVGPIDSSSSTSLRASRRLPPIVALYPESWQRRPHVRA